MGSNLEPTPLTSVTSSWRTFVEGATTNTSTFSDHPDAAKSEYRNVGIFFAQRFGEWMSEITGDAEHARDAFEAFEAEDEENQRKWLLRYFPGPIGLIPEDHREAFFEGFFEYAREKGLAI